MRTRRECQYQRPAGRAWFLRRLIRLRSQEIQKGNMHRNTARRHWSYPRSSTPKQTEAQVNEFFFSDDCRAWNLRSCQWYLDGNTVFRFLLPHFVVCSPAPIVRHRRLEKSRHRRTSLKRACKLNNQDRSGLHENRPEFVSPRKYRLSML